MTDGEGEFEPPPEEGGRSNLNSRIENSSRSGAMSSADSPAAVARSSGSASFSENISGSTGASSSARAQDPNSERITLWKAQQIEKAKKQVPALSDTIERWSRSDSDTQATIERDILAQPNLSHNELVARDRLAKFLKQTAQIENIKRASASTAIQTSSSSLNSQVDSPSLASNVLREAANNEITSSPTGTAESTNETVNRFIVTTRAAKTMACLAAIDVGTFPMSDFAMNLMIYNEGVNWNNTPLIFNNAEPPAALQGHFFDDPDTLVFISPTIIPADVKTTYQGNSTPTREPQPDENRQIRMLIAEALYHYHANDEYTERTKEVISIITAPQSLELPITVGGLQSLLENLTRDPDNPFRNYPNINPSLAHHVILHYNSKEIPEWEQQLVERTTIPHRALGRAAYHTASAIVRSAGLVVGSIAGLAGKNAIIGAVIPYTLTNWTIQILDIEFA